MQVKIARVCHCVIKNGIKQLHVCEDVEEARCNAKETVLFLEAHNCKAHRFFIRESVTEIIIDSTFNVDDISLK